MLATPTRLMFYTNVFSTQPSALCLSRYGVNFSARNDFPRYHPRAAARRRSGSTDISRYGLAFHLPDKEFRYLRTVHSCYFLNANALRWLDNNCQLSRSPVRSDHLIPEPAKAQSSAYGL